MCGEGGWETVCVGACAARTHNTPALNGHANGVDAPDEEEKRHGQRKVGTLVCVHSRVSVSACVFTCTYARACLCVHVCSGVERHRQRQAKARAHAQRGARAEVPATCATAHRFWDQAPTGRAQDLLRCPRRCPLRWCARGAHCACRSTTLGSYPRTGTRTAA